MREGQGLPEPCSLESFQEGCLPLKTLGYFKGLVINYEEENLNQVECALLHWGIFTFFLDALRRLYWVGCAGALYWPPVDRALAAKKVYSNLILQGPQTLCRVELFHLLIGDRMSALIAASQDGEKWD